MLPLVVLAFWIGIYPKPVLDLFERPAQMLAYQVWHQPGAEDRYAPTPEAQEKLARERAARSAADTPAIDPAAFGPEQPAATAPSESSRPLPPPPGAATPAEPRPVPGPAPGGNRP